MPTSSPLSLRSITKRFGATLALDDATLSTVRGSVHALLGENGAGKTTLMRIAFGMLRPDDGTVELDGRPVTFRSPADAIRAGIGMVHQHFTNVPTMTVAENVALGGRGRFRAEAAARRVREIAERTGLALDPAARVGDLAVGAQQRLEIVKALARDARILILDEPTAVLAPAETEELLRWLRGFADGGGTAILITHKLREALAVADAVTVLRRGRTVLEHVVVAVPEALTTDALARAMLGEAPPAAAAAAPPAPGEVVLRAEGLSVRDPSAGSGQAATGVVRVRDATLVVRAGEIVGVAAVEGSGFHELLRALAGRLPIASGRLTLPDEGRGVAFVPEDRHRDAAVLDFPLTENVALKGAGARRGLARWRRWRALTRALLRDYDVRAPGEDVPMGALSGGNQQKLVLARELHDAPGVLIAENPTRGLDVRATAAVHERLRAARDAGMAVVLYSSDLDEVLALASRMVVVHGGVVLEAPLDRDAVGRAMLGLA